MQQVPGYALHVSVSRDTDLVFADWRAAALGSVARTALLCAPRSACWPCCCAS